MRTTTITTTMTRRRLEHILCTYIIIFTFCVQNTILSVSITIVFVVKLREREHGACTKFVAIFSQHKRHAKILYLFFLRYWNASKCTKDPMTASEGEFLHLAGDTVGQVWGLYAGCPVRGGRGRGGPRLLLAGEGGHTTALLQVALQLLQPRQPANIKGLRRGKYGLGKMA